MSEIIWTCAERLSCNIALDGFGGVGGNAVQLAMTCKQVLVCDNNMDRLLLARHNAEIYGVAHKLDFVCCDILKMAPSFKVLLSLSGRVLEAALLSL